MAKSLRAKASTTPPVAKAAVSRGEQIPFTQDEIGGELVSLLSEGLYNNPLDALREYIQNSIDAGATRVTVRFTGSTLFITDNGLGMNWDQLVKARRLAVSEKSLTTNIGFRGIGIYAAFHLCDRMRIKTKVSGVFEQLVAEFDFKAMRTVLGVERGSKETHRTPLTDLFTQHVHFWREENNYEDSRTVIELHSVLELHRATLSSRDYTEKYLLETIPITFAPDFKMGDQINADIRAAWSEYRPIVLILSYPGESDRIIVKPMPTDLNKPKCVDVISQKGEKIAMIWGCRTTKNEQISKAFSDLHGFAYKVKGITVGGREQSRRAFSQPTLYNWWTGEIWVLNDRVVPNAARDGFEYNAASRELEAAVNVKLREEFERESSVFQQTNRALLNLEIVRSDFKRLLDTSQKGLLTLDDLGALVNAREKVKNVLRALQRFGSTDPTITDTRSACRLLEDNIKQLLKTQESGLPTRRVGKRLPTAAASPQEPQAASEMVEAATREAPTIGELLAGLDVGDGAIAQELLSLLVAAVDEVVGPTTETYREIAEAFEAKLDELDLI